MPTFKKYSGIKVCEDFIQRATINTGSYGDSQQSFRPYKVSTGTTETYLIRSTSQASYLNSNMHYFSVDSIKASVDDYDPDDYNGTSTGTCTYNKSVQSGGVSYQIQFTANETATIKCFKFFKTLYKYEGSNSVLMFAIYFDSPISVTSGQILNMSVNFAYDDQQVTII